MTYKQLTTVSFFLMEKAYIIEVEILNVYEYVYNSYTYTYSFFCILSVEIFITCKINV